MALSDQFALATQNPKFLATCKMAAILAAINAQAEDPATLAVPPGYSPSGLGKPAVAATTSTSTTTHSDDSVDTVVTTTPGSAAVPATTGQIKQRLHESRTALAAKILADPQSWGYLFALGIASDPNTAGISATSTDSDIQFTANAIYNAFAVQGSA